MAGKLRKRIRFGQNFLKSPRLVRDLVDLASFDASDIVYEIGPGTGTITAELARRAKRVVAVEVDLSLAERLRSDFRDVGNVDLVGADFLKFTVPDRQYKVFANLPFNITARVMRKLLYERPTPEEAFLIIQKEAARRYAGRPHETLLSLLAKPYYEFEIVRHLRRTDFIPVPDVDAVLLRITKHERPLIEKEDIHLYREFIDYGFSRWKPHLRAAYKNVFSYRQWKRLSRELGFEINATPTALSFEQWLGLYREFRQTRHEFP